MRSLVPLIFLIGLAGIGRAEAQPRPSWDSRGWVPLGERTVNGRVDRDRILVGPYEGRFAKLTMVVEDNDLELLDFRIVFADRSEIHPVVNHFFREGERTQVIRMPFGERVIREIDFKYRNIGPGGNARVQVWGFRVGQEEPPIVVAPPPPPPVTVVTAPPPPPHHSWDTNGWTMLGQRQVNGRIDRDRIEVGRYEGRFRKLMMAVEDSDLELLDFRIVFDDRTEYRPQLSFFFREGQRSRAIDLPYSERTIRFIDIKYRNVRGGGPASVEVWGQRELPPPPPPPPPPPAVEWDQRGWTLLGEKRVDSHVEDFDRIEVARWEPRFHKISLVVLDADMELIDLTVKFKHSEPFHPDVRQFFRAGSRARLIELPGYEERTIRWIEFRYRNLPGEGRARVQVWAR